MVAKIDENQTIKIRFSTLRETLHLLNDVCDTLCPKEHPCGGCRATEVLNMIEKDWKDLNKEEEML